MKSKNLSEKILRSVKSKGFKYIELPSVIETNHIVQRSGESFRKFIFSFTDQKGNELCLRPDLTIASCLRYLENNLKGKEKIFYTGQAYRKSQNKKGSIIRNQVGFEIIGSQDEKNDNKEKKNNQPKPNQISPEQLKNLLKAMDNEEKKVQEKVNKNKVKASPKKNKKDWSVKLIDTGTKTMTGGRLKRLQKYLKNETFFMTYGDGLSDINLKKLVKFHKKNNKTVTMTAVRPPARFGHLKIKGNSVKYFKEKSSLDEGWINGGFFVMNSKFLKSIKNDNTYLERDPLENLAKKRMIRSRIGNVGPSQQ